LIYKKYKLNSKIKYLYLALRLISKDFKLTIK